MSVQGGELLHFQLTQKMQGSIGKKCMQHLQGLCVSSIRYPARQVTIKNAAIIANFSVNPKTEFSQVKMPPQ